MHREHYDGRRDNYAEALYNENKRQWQKQRYYGPNEQFNLPFDPSMGRNQPYVNHGGSLPTVKKSQRFRQPRPNSGDFSAIRRRYLQNLANTQGQHDPIKRNHILPVDTRMYI